MSLELVLAELNAEDGLGSRANVVRQCGRHWVDAALEAGLIEAPARGLLRLPGVDATRFAVAVTGGKLCLRSAALAHGWPVLHVPQRPEVVLPKWRRLRPDYRGISVHRRDVAPDDVLDSATAPVRTVVDCARALPFTEALAIADSALRAGTVMPAELDNASVRGPGAQRARRVLALASNLAANPFESALRALAIEAVGPGFVAQPDTLLRNGAVIHPDVGHSHLRIAFEADSYTYHGDRKGFDRDCWRYNELVAAAWLVLRFTWPHVRRSSGWVQGCMRDVTRLREPKWLTQASQQPQSEHGGSG